MLGASRAVGLVLTAGDGEHASGAAAALGGQPCPWTSRGTRTGVARTYPACARLSPGPPTEGAAQLRRDVPAETAAPSARDSRLKTVTTSANAPLSVQDFELLFDELKNWGRWGPDDELGTLNFLGQRR